MYIRFEGIYKINIFIGFNVNIFMSFETTWGRMLTEELDSVN